MNINFNIGFGSAFGHFAESISNCSCLHQNKSPKELRNHKINRCNCVCCLPRF